MMTHSTLPDAAPIAHEPVTGDVVIRPARPEDLDALVELLVELFSIETDFTPDPVRQRAGLVRLMGTDGACLLVAEETPAEGDEFSGGRVLGMVSLQLLVSTAEGGLAGLLEDMVVAPWARGRGLGRRLLAAVEDWARQRGATRLQLLADADNAPAHGFYGACGWRPTKLVCLRRVLSDEA